MKTLVIHAEDSFTEFLVVVYCEFSLVKGIVVDVTTDCFIRIVSKYVNDSKFFIYKKC
jgi:hypothetical protein